MTEFEQPAERYRRYIEACNRRAFRELGQFVADDVVASETDHGLDAYIAGLEAVVDGFGDYHWRVDQVLVDGEWISARLTGTGTHTGVFRGIPATGSAIEIQELALYRTRAGKITRCWGDLGAVVRDELVSGNSSTHTR